MKKQVRPQHRLLPIPAQQLIDATTADPDATADPDLQTRLVLSLAEVRQQLMLIAAKRGDYAATMRTYQQVRSTLEQGSVNQSNDGKFLLATTINRAVCDGTQTGHRTAVRPRNPILNRLLPNMPDELPPPPGRLSDFAVKPRPQQKQLPS